MVVAVTRKEYTAAQLRAAAEASPDDAAARRMLALALVLEGKSRAQAAEQCGMDRQTLRDWVHRYNAEGLDGLRDRAHSGRPPRLSPEQQAELARIVQAGRGTPSPGPQRWRAIDLQAVIKAEFNVELTERTVGRLLAKLTGRARH